MFFSCENRGTVCVFLIELEWRVNLVMLDGTCTKINLLFQLLKPSKSQFTVTFSMFIFYTTTLFYAAEETVAS